MNDIQRMIGPNARTLKWCDELQDEICRLTIQLSAANAEIERLKAERDGFFEHGIVVAKERDQLRAERDALLNAGCIAMVPVAMKMKETANGKA